MKKLVLFLVSSALFSGGVLGFVVLNYLQTTPGGSGEEQVFSVEPGSLYKNAYKLKSKGFITNAKKFVWLARFKGLTNKIRVGEFSLNQRMTPDEVLVQLTEGKFYQYRFTVQEGLNIYEIADLLERKSLAKKKLFLKLCKDADFIQSLLGFNAPSMEGYLFPETYMIPKSFSEEEIIKLMVSNFKKNFESVRAMPGILKLNPRKHLILASMIEKETGAPFERPVISSVFHNRLKKSMRLQSDPTILYGIMEETGIWKKNITRKDIKGYTRYNTYRVNALPFGPIANPGRDSLIAAVKPKTTDYLYFVSQNDGTHYFSKNIKEHNAAVKRYQLNSKARKGKSWRDLSKKLSQQ